jgi:hypothetical protein
VSAATAAALLLLQAQAKRRVDVCRFQVGDWSLQRQIVWFGI